MLQSGLNAGLWTIGLASCGSLCGLAPGEWQALSQKEREQLRGKATVERGYLMRREALELAGDPGRRFKRLEGIERLELRTLLLRHGIDWSTNMRPMTQRVDDDGPVDARGDAAGGVLPGDLRLLGPGLEAPAALRELEKNRGAPGVAAADAGKAASRRARG